MRLVRQNRRAKALRIHKACLDPSPEEVQASATKAIEALAAHGESCCVARNSARAVVGLIFVFTATVVISSSGLITLKAAEGLQVFGLFGLSLFRLWACWQASPSPEHFTEFTLQREEPSAFPLWSILVAVYKEADSIEPLIANLKKLNWPLERLDLIFACEADDMETLQVLENMRADVTFRIIRVPNIGPRTKPKALQTALPFVRAKFVSVYDAEDRPHPDQLRAAFQAFVDGDPNLAVVQAPLVVWNDTESWISGQFALDYAIWFRVMLPALSRLSGLLPLGGTSNHFRTAILREVGGWDAFNVTEDADLGVRLARCGYRAALISPPTFEEGVVRLGSWVKQRGRWIQGHIQTIGFHLRQPKRLFRDLGLKGSLGFVFGFVMGPFSSALIPALGISLLARPWVCHFIEGAVLFMAVLPYLGQAFLAAKRDGRWRLLSLLLASPFYTALQVPALARALWRVLFTPSVWDKTDHGHAARSKRTAGFCAARKARVKAI